MVMTWAYIAGFFDGEGNIRMPHRSSGQLSLHQADKRGLILFQEIKQFLEGYGIKCSIHCNKRPTPLGKPMYRLYTYNRHGVATFIKYTFPYLRIKKAECQDLMRYLKLFPPTPGNKLFRTPHVPHTHCKYGHELTPENKYLGNRKSRPCWRCVTCAKKSASDRYLRIKAEREKFAKNCKTDPKVARWL